MVNCALSPKRILETENWNAVIWPCVIKPVYLMKPEVWMKNPGYKE